MAPIDLTIDEAGLAGAVKRAQEQNIVIPTLAEMRDPDLVPRLIKEELSGIGLWELHPRNLFRISWHNESTTGGGGFGPVNFVEIPSTFTATSARIVALVGKWFPTGAHKVGAAFGCLVPRLVTGQFDPSAQKAVWPSTGNYCRGGAFDSHLLGCASVAILPEGMSRERFEWLEGVADEVITTPGSESNVKEIFDKCWELRRSGEPVVVFNQFDEFGNYLWHFGVTGPAMEEALASAMRPQDRFRGLVLATGSAGTLASGDYLKLQFPDSMIAAAEALQCPTLLYNGFGDHRIEGIGDKHVPWIHNVGNTDMVIDVDDNGAMAVLRLFGEEAGRSWLSDQGVTEPDLSNLTLFGISGIANLIASIKFARYQDLGPHDVVLTVLTDSVDMYKSRLQELHATDGPFTEEDAEKVHSRWLAGATTDDMLELGHRDRLRVHNLKYFTWVEQQGKDVEELNAQWDPDYWTEIQAQTSEIDELISEFNALVGR